MPAEGTAKGNLIVAVTDDLKSPVALAADREQLIQDPAVLQRLVQQPSTGCSETLPVRPLADLCKGLEKSLRKPVEAFWSQNLKKLPSGLAAIQKTVGKKSVLSLHDERFVRPDVTLSQKLLTTLEAFRKQGDAVYPTRLEDLLKKADVTQDDALLPAALAQPKFAESTQAVAGKLAGSLAGIS